MGYLRPISLILTVAIQTLYVSASAQTVDAASLLALTKTCKQISTGLFSSDNGTPAKIPVCSLKGGVFWTADLDIDCDGVSTAKCNINTDPWYQAETSAQTSTGQFMNAETTPYFVIPQANPIFTYSNHQIQLGSVAVVIYNNKMEYAVFADTGPANIIGEASYSTAKLLGINPDPANGGTDGPVTFIVFTGITGKVQKNEDHTEAIQIGSLRAKQLLLENGGTNIRSGNTLKIPFQISSSHLSLFSEGSYSLEIRNALGEQVLFKNGIGPTEYDMSNLKPGIYWTNLNWNGIRKSFRTIRF